MDPFGNQPGPPPPGNFGPQGPHGPQGHFPPPNNFGGPKPELPNSTAILVLGIVSIFFILLGCAFGPLVLISLITGIITLAISGNAVRMNREAPGAYNGYGNVQAGRIMAIISLAIFGLYVLMFLFIIIFYGAAFSAAMSGGFPFK